MFSESLGFAYSSSTSNRFFLLSNIHWSLGQKVLTCSRRTRERTRLNDSMTLNLCRLTNGIAETDKIYPKKDNFVSLKGIEMTKVHSQWKMSRIGDFRRENLRHKYVLSLSVRTIIPKNSTRFFFFFFRFLCVKTGQQFGRDPVTTYFHFFLIIRIFTWLLLSLNKLTKRY